MDTPQNESLNEGIMDTQPAKEPWNVSQQHELLVQILNNYETMATLLASPVEGQAVTEAIALAKEHSRIIAQNGVPLLNMAQHCVSTLQSIGVIQSEADNEYISTEDAFDNLNQSVNLARDTLQEFGIETKTEHSRPRAKEA